MASRGRGSFLRGESFHRVLSSGGPALEAIVRSGSRGFVATGLKADHTGLA